MQSTSFLKGKTKHWKKLHECIQYHTYILFKVGIKSVCFFGLQSENYSLF